MDTQNTSFFNFEIDLGPYEAILKKITSIKLVNIINLELSTFTDTTIASMRTQ